MEFKLNVDVNQKRGGGVSKKINRLFYRPMTVNTKPQSVFNNE